MLIYHLFPWCGATDIEKEKTHQSIFQGVTGFDKSQMRHAETEEKVALPAKEGIRFTGWCPLPSLCEDGGKRCAV